MGNFSQNDIDRFWSHAAKSSGCWIWRGYLRDDGYGQFRAGKLWMAHRVAYELAHGIALDPDNVIMHTCDNPACVNPAHLRMGTHAANVADRVAKCRSAHGERHGRAKLTLSQVRNIRIRSQHEGTTFLGREYGVDPVVIRKIREGEIWASQLAQVPGKLRDQFALEL